MNRTNETAIENYHVSRFHKQQEAILGVDKVDVAYIGNAIKRGK